MIRIVYSASGLNYNDKDVLLAKLNLVKNKLYPSLVFNTTNFKTKSNSIKFTSEFESLDDAFKLFDILNNIDFVKTKSNNRFCRPLFRMKLEVVDKEYGKILN